MRIKNDTLDIIAVSSSLICAIHCIVIPVLLSFSALSSLHFLENPYIEWAFTIFGLLFVFISLWPSFKKNHHQIKPLLFAALGFTLILIGRFQFNLLWEIGNTVIGAFLVAIAHYFNWQLIRVSENNKSYNKK
ncbi:MerC domain-containing protein [Spongiimicrobium salis]|uniref:MerC domain-containing protein n=1 Tax=Spongiimicrobium salis TaxID=1667022 RepID=UPI00374CD402